MLVRARPARGRERPRGPGRRPSAGGAESTARATRRSPSSIRPTSWRTVSSAPCLQQITRSAGRQVARDDVGVLGLGEARQHPPAGADGDRRRRGRGRRAARPCRRHRSCCPRRGRPRPRPSSTAAAGCGRARAPTPGRLTASIETTSMRTFVAALSETASISRSRSASVSAGLRVHALEQAAAARRRRRGDGDAPLRVDVAPLDRRPERGRHEHLDRARGGHDRVRVSLEPAAGGQIDGRDRDHRRGLSPRISYRRRTVRSRALSSAGCGSSTTLPCSDEACTMRPSPSQIAMWSP